MPEAPATPGRGRQALLLARLLLAACPAPSELEQEPPELLLLPVDPFCKKSLKYSPAL
jgi:hypothetical protein